MGKLLDFVLDELKVKEDSKQVTEYKQQFLDLFSPGEMDDIKKDLDRLAEEGGNGE